MRGIKTIALAGTLAFAGLAALAPFASADDSQIRIREVYSDLAATKSDFVELQLAAANQQLAAGSAVRLYNGNASATATFEVPPGVPTLDNQRTILLGWDTNPEVDIAFNSNFNPTPNGAACLLQTTADPPNETPIDCVSWGTFTGTATVTTAGTPAPALNAAQSLTRTIVPNCPTMLEIGDDTNNSAVDFALGAPTPRNSGVTPTEFGCLMPTSTTTTTAKKKCKKKKKKKRSAAVAKKKSCKKKKKKSS
jgi:uncharacterized protein